MHRSLRTSATQDLCACKPHLGMPGPSLTGDAFVAPGLQWGAYPAMRRCCPASRTPRPASFDRQPNAPQQKKRQTFWKLGCRAPGSPKNTSRKSCWLCLKMEASLLAHNKVSACDNLLTRARHCTQEQEHSAAHPCEGEARACALNAVVETHGTGTAFRSMAA